MHKIYINLHNLKYCFDFQYGIFARLFVSTWFMYVPNYKIFPRSAAEIRGGGVRGGSTNPPPPPPACEMGSKDPRFFRVKEIMISKKPRAVGTNFQATTTVWGHYLASLQTHPAALQLVAQSFSYM